MTEPAIVLDDVSKRFKRYPVRQPLTLKEFIVNLKRVRLWERRDGQSAHIEVLKAVSFSVDQGQTFAIIGRNGSGKSTLLKLLAGIYRPDSGSVRVRGQVSALLSLGVGFHPDLTGRENVFINGLVLGLTRREIREKFDEIVNFAEIEEFIDAPVRTYSSGMYVRLAFSIAVNVDPDVLLIDEVLAVGDANFTQKCRERMDGFKRAGKTILVVTHDLALVEEWCDRALWLDRGEVRALGDPRETAALYRQEVLSHV